MEQENTLHIAQRLKELRLKNGFEQQDVAKYMGYKSDSTISKWESGKNLPNGGKLAQLAKLFNTSTDYILYGEIFAAQSNISTKKYSSPLLDIIETTEKLSNVRQNNVLDYATEQLEKQQSEHLIE